MSEYIQQLRDAILKNHGVESTHIESVPVKEIHKGQTVWEGAVEVFQLWRHPKAEYAYAWTHGTDDGRLRHVTVLKVHPVQSAADAVRLAIVKEFRSGNSTAEEA